MDKTENPLRGIQLIGSLLIESQDHYFSDARNKTGHIFVAYVPKLVVDDLNTDRALVQ
jgi:hypothetical protein